MWCGNDGGGTSWTEFERDESRRQDVNRVADDPLAGKACWRE